MSRTIRNDIKRAAFLKSLATGASVTKALAVSSLSRTASYAWRAKDSEFAAAWDEALAVGTDLLIDEVRRRAVEGTRRPIMHQGRICYRVADSGDLEELWLRDYSDTLLMFLLKSRDRERFDDSAARVKLERQ